jgi:hypothetical protein
MKRPISISAALLVLALGLYGCAHEPYDPSWISLINGEQGLENFNRLGKANWRAEDGVILVDKGGKTSSHLVTKKSYRNFQLRAEFWVSHNANSGIFIRVKNPKKIGANSAYEVNIYDQRGGQNYGTGAIVNIAPVLPMPKAGGKWNTFDITAKGSHLTVVLNGELTVDTYNSEYSTGPISLQYGKGIVKFRRLEIKPL